VPCIIGNISYYNETESIRELVAAIQDSGYVHEGSLEDWHGSFIEWVKTSEAKDVGYYGFGFWMASKYGTLFRETVLLSV